MTKRTLDLEADDTELMEIWHEQTKFHRASLGRRNRKMHRFFTEPNLVKLSSEGWEVQPGDKVISLCRSEAVPGQTLSETLAYRVSTPRQQLGTGLEIIALGELLHLAVESNRQSSPSIAPEAKFYFRPYPSAGGLYPCELFVIPGQIEGLDRKPYRYDARLHALVDFAGEGGRFPAVEIDTDLAAPAAAFVIAAILDRSTQKYGPRGYRMACLEAGHLGQNLTLAATAVGLKSLIYSAFCDEELERWLGLDGRNEVVLSAVLIGAP